MIIDVLTAAPVGEAVENDGSDEVLLTLGYTCFSAIEVVFHFSIWTRDGQVCITAGRSFPHHSLEPGGHEIRCHISHLPLMPGTYTARCALRNTAETTTLAELGWSSSAVPFVIPGKEKPQTKYSPLLKQLIKVDFRCESFTGVPLESPEISGRLFPGTMTRCAP